jgi:hypothetical protein
MSHNFLGNLSPWVRTGSGSFLAAEIREKAAMHNNKTLACTKQHSGAAQYCSLRATKTFPPAGLAPPLHIVERAV